MSPLIPIPAEQIPTRVEKMDDTIPYRGVIRDVNLSPGLDKNGRKFISINVQVIEPLEWKDRQVSLNYISLPGKYDESGNPITLNDYEMKAELQRLGQSNGLGRLLESARMKGTFEKEDLVGREIGFMIKNEEYPKDSDNWMPRISLFLQ